MRVLRPRTPALVFALVCAAGCSDSTRVVVRVDSDIPRAMLGAIRLEAGPSDGELTVDRLYRPDRDLPFSFVVLPPSGDPDRRARVLVRSDEADVEQEATEVDFVRGQTLLLQLELRSSCVAQECPAGETCVRGSCAPSDAFGTRPITPGDELREDAGGDMDAGERLDASRDAGAPDAGPDARPPELDAGPACVPLTDNTCVDPGPGSASPGEEACDREDDDIDGRFDEWMSGPDQLGTSRGCTDQWSVPQPDGLLAVGSLEGRMSVAFEAAGAVYLAEVDPPLMGRPTLTRLGERSGLVGLELWPTSFGTFVFGATDTGVAIFEDGAEVRTLPLAGVTRVALAVEPNTLTGGIFALTASGELHYRALTLEGPPLGELAAQECGGGAPLLTDLAGLANGSPLAAASDGGDASFATVLRYEGGSEVIERVRVDEECRVTHDPRTVATAIRPDSVFLTYVESTRLVEATTREGQSGVRLTLLDPENLGQVASTSVAGAPLLDMTSDETSRVFLLGGGGANPIVGFIGVSAGGFGTPRTQVRDEDDEACPGCERLVGFTDGPVRVAGIERVSCGLHVPLFYCLHGPLL